MTDERLVIAERALAAEQRGDWTAAHNAWTDLLVVHPDHGEAHFRLGLAAVRLSAFGAAEAELRRALDLFEAQRPQDPRPLIALAEPPCAQSDTNARPTSCAARSPSRTPRPPGTSWLSASVIPANPAPGRCSPFVRLNALS